MKNNLKFSPIDNLEIGFGFNRIFPARATLDHYDDEGVLIQSQRVRLSYVDDYLINARLRLNTAELYLDMQEKLQKSKRDLYSTYHGSTHFRVFYRDFKFGARYISAPVAVQDETNLSMVTTPLLDSSQVNLEGELGYKQGKMDRDDKFNRTYRLGSLYQVLSPQYIPRFLFRYGLSQGLEAELGLSYTMPYKYTYQLDVIYTDGTNLYDYAKFKLKNSFSFPMELRWRPWEVIDIAFSSDFNYANQSIDYYQKSRAGVSTTFPTKKLTYINTKPTLVVTYLNGADKKIQKDKFSSLTKTLIFKNQFLFEFEAKRDFTTLNKGSTGGAQNIIDPYNIFIYPAEYFVFGTEYAYPFAGNYTYACGNINAQNYYRIKGGFTYGLTDTFNAGVDLGYQSASALHSFMVPDFVNRFCKFKPYYFIDPYFDWRITRNSLLSFKSHIVPNYKTFYKEDTAVDRKGESSYYDASIAFKTLF